MYYILTIGGVKLNLKKKKILIILLGITVILVLCLDFNKNNINGTNNRKMVRVYNNTFSRQKEIRSERYQLFKIAERKKQLEEEARRLAEEEARRLAEEEEARRLAEEAWQENIIYEEQQTIDHYESSQVYEKSTQIPNGNMIECVFEVSFYTTAPDEGSGTGMGASGEYVQPWVSIALPPDIPFYSTTTIEGLGTFINHDTGSYIQWAGYDESTGLPICRVDVCVSTKEEAFSLGRFYSKGFIILN